MTTGSGRLKRWLVYLCVFALVFSITPSVVPFDQNLATVEAASVKISQKKLTLIKGQSKTLKIKGSRKKVTWSTSKKKVATVSKKGKVTAKGKGTATITAKIGKKKYTCRVTVESPSLNKKSVTLKKNQTYNLKLRGTKQKVTWKTNKKKVATVTKRGRVTAKGNGTAIITATVARKKYQCRVTVNAKGTKTVAVSNISINENSIILERNQTYKLKASVSPSNATNKKVVWSSSNPSVASVDQSGNVRGVGAGKATITAKAGNKSARCAVDVYKTTAEAEEPDFSVFMSSETSYSTYWRLLLIENTGTKPLRIYSRDARSIDADYISYNRDLDLIDPIGLEYDRIDGISYVDIQPGQEQIVYFYHSDPGWYDQKTTVCYYFKYDTITYRATSSSYYGSEYDEGSVHIID